MVILAFLHITYLHLLSKYILFYVVCWLKLFKVHIGHMRRRKKEHFFNPSDNIWLITLHSGYCLLGFFFCLIFNRKLYFLPLHELLPCFIVLGGMQCPNSSALQETRSCNEHSCTVYHWQTGPWGQCIEDTSVSAFNSSASWNGEATCSVGMQTRKVICVRVNVGQVGPKK